jgi:hypothetical protein
MAVGQNRFLVVTANRASSQWERASWGPAGSGFGGEQAKKQAKKTRGIQSAGKSSYREGEETVLIRMVLANT